MTGPVVISYGGGVQSTAMLVLAAQGRLGYPVTHALFANVGDQAEHPRTLAYVRDVAAPFAAAQDTLPFAGPDMDECDSGACWT